MLLNFKPRFVDPILIGTKVHTLRKRRKNQPKVGETMHMYSGLRTNHCKMITKDEKLISIQRIFIKFHFSVNGSNKLYHRAIEVSIDGKRLNQDKLNQLAAFDGFNNISDFTEFWLKDVIKFSSKPLVPFQCYKYLPGPMFIYHWTDLRY